MPQRAEHTDISYCIGKTDPFLLIQLLPIFIAYPIFACIWVITQAICFYAHLWCSFLQYLNNRVVLSISL